MFCSSHLYTHTIYYYLHMSNILVSFSVKKKLHTTKFIVYMRKIIKKYLNSLPWNIKKKAPAQIMLESLSERKSNVEHRTRSITTKHVIDAREEPARWILQPQKSVDWSRFRGRIRAENVSTQIFPQIDGHRTNVIEELELRIGIDD